MKLKNILNESLDLIKNKEFEKALKNLEQIENKNSKVYFLIGSIFLSLKKIDLAENNLLLAYKLNENNYSILNNLGIISNIKGDIKNTKRYFLKAIRIEENIETLSEIGRIYKQEKDFKTAENYFQMVLSKNANHQKTNKLLGEMYLEINEIQKGWKHNHRATGLIRFSEKGVEII